jgi:ribonuclease HI
MYFDGSLRLQGAGAGILFLAPGGDQLKYALQLLFPASNNAAEYEALVHGLSIAISLGIKRLMVYGDSLVVISQVNKDWDCSIDSMNRYYAAVQKVEDKFEGLEFHHVERGRNASRDTAAKRQSWGPVGPKFHLGFSSKRYNSQASPPSRLRSATFWVRQKQIPTTGGN